MVLLHEQTHTDTHVYMDEFGFNLNCDVINTTQHKHTHTHEKETARQEKRTSNESE